ncbi:antirepressor protein [Dermabacter hominis]
MGLDFSSQRKRLDRTPWAVVVMMTTVGADGKDREMVTIDRRTFTVWGK